MVERATVGAATDERLHVLVVDDDGLVVDLIDAFLQAQDISIRVTKATSMPQALSIVESTSDLHLVLLDLHMPMMNGMSGLRWLRERRPELPVCIISGEGSLAAARAAQEAGACGFIPKRLGAPEFISALRLMLNGEEYFPADTSHLEQDGGAGGRNHSILLSSRERQVLEKLAEGASNKEIARAISIEVVTVTMHLTNLYRKLNAANRTQAVRRAFDLGLLSNRRG